MKKTPILLRSITPLADKAPTKPESKFKSVFILSSGRTGTKFFGEILNDFDGVYAVHEPKPSYRLRMWSHAYLEERVSDQTMRSVLYHQRRKILARSDFKIYVESSPFITGFTRFLGDVFSNPLVIHIVRDPRDYVKSSLNHGTSTGLKFFLNKHLPFWFANVEKILDKDRQLDMPLKVVGFWRIVNEHIEQNTKRYDYHMYKFEDLFSEDKTHLYDLFKKIGVNTSFNKNRGEYTKINKSHLNVLPSWSSWSDEFCAEIDLMCGDMMRKYGYGLEEEWQNKVSNGLKHVGQG